jgi:SEC-C motif-containing protein
MRARYTAYTQGDIDFVARTNDPHNPEPFDAESAKAWSKSSKWLGLEVVKTEKGGDADNQGKVEFIARFRAEGEDHAHHEIATFRRRGGTWLFVDGKTPGVTVRKDTPEPGRNDPCPCGSGKKFKKCCAK